jgi:hypothetical protein
LRLAGFGVASVWMNMGSVSVGYGEHLCPRDGSIKATRRVLQLPATRTRQVTQTHGAAITR